MVRVYASGVVSGSSGRGGWAAVVLDDQGLPSTYSGVEQETTQRRIELKAAIEGLLRTPPGCAATVFTRSRELADSAGAALASGPDSDLRAVLGNLLARRTVSWSWVTAPEDMPSYSEAHLLARKSAGVAQQATGNVSPIRPLPFVARAEEPPPPIPISGVEREPSAGAPETEAADAQQKADAPELTHLDQQGNARMVDISAKAETDRVAVARGRVVMKRATLDLIRTGKAAKGDVISVARVAGIMAAKQTANLIPLCHPLLLTKVEVDFQFDETQDAVEITATAKTSGQTGVEMEALTAVSISALTIYDMCKAGDRGMRIEGIRLTLKSGGKSGEIVLE